MNYIKEMYSFSAQSVENYNALPNIAVCGDKNVIKAMGVLLFSVLRNIKVRPAVHIFYNGDVFPEEDTRRMKSLADTFGCAMNIYYWKNTLVNRLHATEDISATAYYRLLAPYVLKRVADIKKMLYLDVDMLCVQDISGIFSFNLKDKIAYVVNDIGFDIGGGHN